MYPPSSLPPPTKPTIFTMRFVLLDRKSMCRTDTITNVEPNWGVEKGFAGGATFCQDEKENHWAENEEKRRFEQKEQPGTRDTVKVQGPFKKQLSITQNSPCGL